MASCIAAIVIATAPPASAAQIDFSLRIGTLNTWFLAPPGSGFEYPAFPCFGVLIGYCCFPGTRGPFPDSTPPHIWTCEAGTHEVHDEEAILFGIDALADRIIKSGYDVIALNEVWWEEAFFILAERLGETYPHGFGLVGNPDATTTHSGLALFSKFPILDLPVVYQNDWTGYSQGFVIRSGNYDDPGRYLAFAQMTAEGTDAFASKGVAYVRLQSTNARIHNVYVTHMQATYVEHIEDDPLTWHGLNIREQGMTLIHEFINAGMGTGEVDAATEDIFVMGDLNIDGDLSVTVDDLNLNGTTVTQYDNLGEWSRYFAAGTSWRSGFFDTVLHDTWARQHPSVDTLPASEPTEFGTTNTGPCTSKNSAPNCRIDYILHNTPVLDTNRLCNQHPHIAFNLDSGPPLLPGANPPGGRDDLSDGLAGQPTASFRSDHVGLMEHFNRLAPQCSPLLPATAQDVYGSSDYGVETITNAQLGNTAGGDKDYVNEAELLTGILSHPGSVQWWRVEDPGTYLIGFEDDQDPTYPDTSREIGYRVMVFSSKSLSTPVPSYGKEEYEGVVDWFVPGVGDIPITIVGHKYVFDEPPYYIKVFHPEQHLHDVPFNAAGTYRFAVRRLGCTDRSDDACPLLPNTPLIQPFPQDPIPSSPTPDSLYFTMHVEPLTVPNQQQLEFVAFDYPLDYIESAVVDPTSPTDDVVVAGGPLENLGFDDREAIEGITTGSQGYGQPCPFGTGPMGVPELTGCNNRVTWAHPQPPGQTAQERVWRVRRSLSAPAMVLPLSVVWTTDLTAFYGRPPAHDFGGMNMQCLVSTSDGSPHDEIYMEMTVDGVAMLSGAQIAVGRFTDGIPKVVDSIFPIFTGGRLARYRQGILLTLVEDDEIGQNREDEWIYPLARNVFGPGAAQRDDFLAEWLIDDGHYTMAHLRSHGTQRFTAP